MSAAPLISDVRTESWPLKHPFAISRGTIDHAHVVHVTVSDGEFEGRGEAVPSSRYAQTIPSVLKQLRTLQAGGEVNRRDLADLLPPGAARNALDCALWDLEAKRSGRRAWELAGQAIASEVQTSFTISLNTPGAMGAVAAEHDLPLLKLKLNGDERDLARVEAVRQSAPAARLIVDANESWSVAHYSEIVPKLARLGVEVIEQPFPAQDDEVLGSLEHPLPVCADESCHTTADLPRILGRYEAINVKLDKTGGLTEALELTRRARESGLKLFFGCMVCTSLGIAPARILPDPSDYVDLDGPLLLAKDREHALHYDEKARLGIPSPALWG